MEGAIVKYMIRLLLVAILLCCGILSWAQTEYEVSSDGTYKILKGTVTREMLENDTAFRWFHDSLAGYVPNSETVSILRARGSAIRFVVFFGTWCEDSRNLLPKFFALLDASSIGNNQVRLVGVDHQKKSTTQLPEVMHLTNTPTFIILKGDAEVGRVVEFGKNGAWDKEIGDIVAAKF
jgi:hypothetical protein